ncbi:helix-turn-helix domain-containing protein [Flavobacterium sp. JP2137]|uniref:helix-turn-helix domain-containing protein n=1 Tax=Flavobacterium sp. JP2137 TaxID=3414510 RepID=UPI003D2FE11A
MVCFYGIFLSNIALLALVNMYFDRFIYTAEAYRGASFVFQCFLLFHCALIGGLLWMGGEGFWIDLSAPLGFFYAPFFYTLVSVWAGGVAKPMHYSAMHFVLGFIGILLAAVLLRFYRDDAELVANFALIVYGLVCLQVTAYTLMSYIEFHRLVRDKMALMIMSQATMVLLATSLVFITVIFSELRQKAAVFNSFVIAVLMWNGVIIMLRYNLLLVARKFAVFKSVDTTQKSKESFSITSKGRFATNRVYKRKNTAEQGAGKYERSRISEVEMQIYLQRLEAVMDSKIYLDCELSLDILAKTTRIPKYHLTQVFNQGLHSNFNRFINAKRVAHAVCFLDDPDNRDTVLTILLQSGFNSRPSFYRAFAEHYELSPADYRKYSHAKSRNS